MMARCPARRRRAGVVTAEFSIVLVWFLLMCSSVLEVARVMYMLNTLQAVTLRAASRAASTDPGDAAALDAVRQHAVFRQAAGGLLLGAPVTDAAVRIDYLALTGSSPDMTPIAAAALPACAANNRITCLNDPNDGACIRLVRARICDPAVADSCQPLRYRSLFSFLSLPLKLPQAPAIVPAESLGAAAGAPPCP